MDWTDTGYEYLVEVLVVSQTNVDEIKGVLKGFVYQGATVSENYNSDSRVQAKVSTLVPEGTSDGYIDNCRLRIVVTIPSRNWSEEFVTGYVTNISEKSEHGFTRREYTIEGTIWGLINHKVNSPVTVSKGGKLFKLFTSLMALTKMQYSYSNGQEYTFARTAVYEVGDTISHILFDATSGHNRLDTNGHGVVELRKYIEPSKREADRVVDFYDVRGLMMHPLDMTHTKWEAPGRAIVTATVSVEDEKGNTTQKVVYGSYDSPASHFSSLATRGWLSARSDAYTGVHENPDKAELNKEAQKNWENSQKKYRTWTASSVFADYHAGEVLELILNDENKTTVKVLLEGVRTDFEKFTQELTMKEV